MKSKSQQYEYLQITLKMRLNSYDQPEQYTLPKNRIDKGAYQDSPEKQQKLNTVVCQFLFLLFCTLIFCLTLYSGYVQGSKQQLIDIQSVKQMITSDRKLQNYQPKNFYWFSVSTKDLILNTDLDSLYRRDRQVYSLKRQQHLRALLFTQLIHNVNFRGQIQVQMSPFDTSLKHKKRAIEMLMKYQLDYYDKKYQVMKFEQSQLPFCIVVPSYNNVKSQLYLRNLDSIFMQDYHNYHVVYIDDHSPDKTGSFVNQYIKNKKIPEQKIQVIINSQNKKALGNIYEGIHKYCKDGEIVGLIDGDDSLNGRQVLKLFNAVFQQRRIGVLYSNFLKINGNSRTDFGFGTTVTKQYYEAGDLRNYWPLVATHFMTFYSDLFKKIRKEDFCYHNGTFYDYAYDRAILTPLLQMAFPRIHYLPQMVYEYRNDTGMNDGGSDWYRVSVIIRDQSPYENLKQFPFIDNNQIIQHASNKIKEG